MSHWNLGSNSNREYDSNNSLRLLIIFYSPTLETPKLKGLLRRLTISISEIKPNKKLLPLTGDNNHTVNYYASI